MPGGASAQARFSSSFAGSRASRWARRSRCSQAIPAPIGIFRPGSRRRTTSSSAASQATATLASSFGRPIELVHRLARRGGAMAHEVVVLGGGVGGTLLANLLARRLRPAEAHVIVVDASGRHVYQPGWLYVPFGEEKPEKLVRPERRLLDRRVDLIVQPARRIEPRRQQVILADGSTVAYDTLVIATGAVLAPDAVSGYTAGAHHFYSEEAARALGETLARFTGGRLVIGVADIPYRCPPAPLEFAFKVEEYLTRRGLRDRTEIIYLSPINRVFTIESDSAFVAPLLEQRGIRSETFFNVERV